MKVWLVSSGDYSDYQVHCAFTTEALAEEYVALRNASAREKDRAWYLKNNQPIPEWLTREDYGEFRVEDRDLFDSVPIVQDEDA